MEEQFSRFLEMFKKIEINIPFAEALAQIPNDTKFLKDILSNRKFVDEGVVSLTDTCSIVIQRRLQMKIQDPCSFTIPCTIGNSELGKALCGLGESINLMPLSVVKRLNFGELTPITMTLQMTNRSMVQLEGILEDLCIKVGNFIFLIDFVVMNIEEDKHVPLLELP